MVNCPKEWAGHIEKVLFTEDQIQVRVKELALQISKDYQGQSIMAVGILTGAVCFMTDLLKYMLVPYTVSLEFYMQYLVSE